MSSLGTVGQIQPQDLGTSSSTRQCVVGSYAETPDGRGFRYVLAGAADLAPGKLVQSSAEDTTNLENLAIAAAAAGATSVTTTTTVTVTANQVAGGYLIVTTGPGAGTISRISGHGAATAAAVTFNLEDPLPVALTTSSKIDVPANPYYKVVVNPTTATSAAVGVAQNGTITAAQYGWVQTHGPAALLAAGSIAVGTLVASSTATAGAGAPASFSANTGTVGVIGYSVTGIATTEYGLVFLTID